MSKPNQLFLLADHIKLSLLERQRAQTLNLDSDDSQDGNISRNLDHFRESLTSLRLERDRLEQAGDQRYVFNRLGLVRHHRDGCRRLLDVARPSRMISLEANSFLVLICAAPPRLLPNHSPLSRSSWTS